LIGEYYDEQGSKTGAQDRMIELQNQTRERYRTCIQEAVRCGVRIALGSDFVGWDPKVTAREFRYLSELGGMSPINAIIAGTASGADLLQRSDLGRVAVGCKADLVVINAGNPIDNLSLLETGVCFVMKNGQTVRWDINDATKSEN
jgi:imidazolonepropionase-like amidohydrolase